MKYDNPEQYIRYLHNMGYTLDFRQGANYLYGRLENQLLDLHAHIPGENTLDIYRRAYDMITDRATTRCVCCLREIRECIHADDPAQGGWYGAGVDNFVPGYGSKYDNTTLLVSICDDCITKGTFNGSIKVRD